MQYIYFVAKRAKFNFGPASKRDAIVYGASGAGYVHPSVRKSCTYNWPGDMKFKVWLKGNQWWCFSFKKADTICWHATTTCCVYRWIPHVPRVVHPSLKRHCPHGCNFWETKAFKQWYLCWLKLSSTFMHPSKPRISKQIRNLHVLFSSCSGFFMLVNMMERSSWLRMCCASHRWKIRRHTLQTLVSYACNKHSENNAFAKQVCRRLQKAIRVFARLAECARHDEESSVLVEQLCQKGS